MKGCGRDGLLPLPGQLAIAVRDFWHCLHIMRSRVYEMVQCPSEWSICLPVPAWAHSSKPAAAGLLLWAQPAGTINWLLQQQVDKCRQRHFVRVHSSWTHRLTWHYAHAKCCILVHFESEKICFATSEVGIPETQPSCLINSWPIIYLFRACCSGCRFQPYDCVIIRFVE